MLVNKIVHLHPLFSWDSLIIPTCDLVWNFPWTTDLCLGRGEGTECWFCHPSSHPGNETLKGDGLLHSQCRCLSFPRAIRTVTNNKRVGAKSIDTENRARSVGVLFQFLFLFTVPAGCIWKTYSKVIAVHELLFHACLSLEEMRQELHEFRS